MIYKLFKHAGQVGLRSEADERLDPVPAGAEVAEFDGDTNPGLIRSLNGEDGFRWQDHDVVGGQILRGGSPVTINTEGPHQTKRRQARQLVTALEAGTATSNQVQRALAFLIREHFREIE